MPPLGSPRPWVCIYAAFPEARAALCTAGIQPVSQRMVGGERRGPLDLWGELGSLTPQPPPTSIHPAPLQLWKLVPQPRKGDLLEVSCLLLEPANQARGGVGEGGTSPTSKDKGLRAGPEGLGEGRCLKACAPETEEGGRRREVGSRRGETLRW